MKAKILAALIVAGCALEPRTAAEREDLEYTRGSEWVEAVERFERLQRACRAARGYVDVRRVPSRVSEQELTTDEMNSARCVRYR